MSIVVHNAEVEAEGHRFARALDAAGVPVRATVAALLANTPAYLETYRGSTGSGRRMTPMSWRWTAEEVAYVVENCEAEALVVDARFAGAIADAARSVPAAAKFCVGGEIPGFRPWSDLQQESPEPLSNPLCGDVMLYTSGTTGRPKGVRRPFLPDQPPPTIIGRAGRTMIETFLPPEHRTGAHLVSCPLYHVAPTTYSDGALLLGADVVLMERFDPEDLLRQVERHRVVSTFLVPTQFVRLLRLPEKVRNRYDLSSLRLVMHGAAPVAVEIKRQMIEWLGPILFEFYGGTEGGGVMINSQDWLAHPGSVGRPRPGLEVHILDDQGAPVPTGEAGAVYFLGEDAPFEYKDDAEKTAEAHRGEYYTLGDIGRVDADGFLYLLDRRADVIISGG
ncbi:MAG: AMP-binding protein, partial [Myxococcota bacterium]